MYEDVKCNPFSGGGEVNKQFDEISNICQQENKHIVS